MLFAAVFTLATAAVALGASSTTSSAKVNATSTESSAAAAPTSTAGISVCVLECVGAAAQLDDCVSLCVPFKLMSISCA